MNDSGEQDRGPDNLCGYVHEGWPRMNDLDKNINRKIFHIGDLVWLDGHLPYEVLAGPVEDYHKDFYYWIRYKYGEIPRSVGAAKLFDHKLIL